MEGYTEVFTWGNNQYGQLGLGSQSSSTTHPVPRFCTFSILIKQVSCGYSHAAFISHTGYLYTMGSNTSGQLGVGEHVSQCSSPCLVEALAQTKTQQVSCGGAHTCCIVQSGLLYSWGLGESGALGLGDTQSRSLPVLVRLDENCKAEKVSCGGRHTALLAKGYYRTALYTWGRGDVGQLGNASRENQLSPSKIQISEILVDVDCGEVFTALLTRDGRVLMSGANSAGQLGRGNTKNSYVFIEVDGLEKVVVRAVKCGEFTAAVTEEGELYAWGNGELRPKNLELEDIVDCDVGGVGMAVKENGEVWIWGRNSSGELGTGDYKSREKPVKVQNLVGRFVKNISSGGNFVIGLGQDVYVHERPSTRRERPSAKKPVFKTPRPLSPFDKNRVCEMEELKSEVARLTNGSRQMESLLEDHQLLLKSYKNEIERRKESKVHKKDSSQSTERNSVNSKVKELQLQLQNEKTEKLILMEEKTRESPNFSRELTFESDLKVKSLEQELQNLKQKHQEDSAVLGQELDETRRENITLRSKLEEATKQKNLYVEYYNQEVLRKQTSHEGTLEELKSQLQELEKKNRVLQRKNEEYIKYTNEQQEVILQTKCLLEHYEKKLLSFEQENTQLKTELKETQDKNKELFQVFEKNLLGKARVFKDKTLQILNTPNKSFEENTKPAFSPVFKTPQDEKTHNTPPTFRGEELQNSLAEIKSRVDNLQESKQNLKGKFSECK